MVTYESANQLSEDHIIDCGDAVANQYDVKSLGDGGDDKTHLTETSKADLHKQPICCTKNSGSKDFIPVGTFTLEQLPERHRDNDLYELIKYAAELTVRVDVRMTSPHRPDVWPKTNTPYPFYDRRGSTNLTTGSGKINKVLKFTDGLAYKFGTIFYNDCTKCCCNKCEIVNTPSSVWWEICVITATHMVYDDIEAMHMSLTLFHDSEDSKVVSLDNKLISLRVNVEQDRCRLKCVTCDENLGNKLMKLFDHYLYGWEKVRYKYKKYRNEDKFGFIVSHPHGGPKHVCLSNGIKELPVDMLYTTHTSPPHRCPKQASIDQHVEDMSDNSCTTCTCAESCGVYIHCFG